MTITTTVSQSKKLRQLMNTYTSSGMLMYEVTETANNYLIVTFYQHNKTFKIDQEGNLAEDASFGATINID